MLLTLTEDVPWWRWSKNPHRESFEGVLRDYVVSNLLMQDVCSLYYQSEPVSWTRLWLRVGLC